jgi:hypothetical protein
MVVSWTHASNNVSSLSDLAVLKLGSSSWSTYPANQVLYAGASGTALGTTVYIIGGSATDILSGVPYVWSLDASTSNAALKSMDDVPVGISSHCAVEFLGIIYVAGGYAYVELALHAPCSSSCGYDGACCCPLPVNLLPGVGHRPTWCTSSIHVRRRAASGPSSGAASPPSAMAWLVLWYAGCPGCT